MADDKSTTQDPEEVAAQEAGEQTPEVVEADKKVVRANAKAEEEANTDDKGNEVDPAIHTPHIVRARKR